LGYTRAVFAAKPDAKPTLTRVEGGLRPQTLETLTTPFNTMVVRKIGARIDLDVEGATYATWHPDAVLTGYSWDGLSVACLLGRQQRPRSVLLLGLGGGTVARQLLHFCPGVQITGVEIDPGVVDIARRHLHLDARVTVVVEDAYAYLARAAETFDVVIDDLFLTGATDVVRARVPEGDTLALLRKRLNPGGLVVCNLITDVGDHAAVRRRTRAAFRSAFDSARVVRPPRGLNEILVGGASVAAKSALKPYAASLSVGDRALFDAIAVTKL